MTQTKLFDKDECAPDAKTLDEFLKEYFGCPRVSDLHTEGTIRLNVGDGSLVIWSRGTSIYMEEYSCGQYETFYRIEQQDVELIVQRHLRQYFLHTLGAFN